jgi:hypothetical protein
MSKTLPLIKPDNTDPEKPKSRISELEAGLLAVLAFSHPQRLDAIDVFNALWRTRHIPTPSLSEAMEMLVLAMSHMEKLGYASCKDEGAFVWYALTPEGASLILGDSNITDEIAGLHALMGADRLAGGGKPC